MSSTHFMTQLKKIIKARGLKQVWLAERIAVDSSVLSRYISGERPTPPSVLKAIAKVLRVSQASLA
jgi:transcriptional regulator with XRE-family HTH domain